MLKTTAPQTVKEKGKSHCTCDDCGVQILFRGKAAMERSQRLASAVDSQMLHSNIVWMHSS
jgi:DNA-directed RNA polymerase subunit RPC12/RpoP